MSGATAPLYEHAVHPAWWCLADVSLMPCLLGFKKHWGSARGEAQGSRLQAGGALQETVAPTEQGPRRGRYRGPGSLCVIPSPHLLSPQGRAWKRGRSFLSHFFLSFSFLPPITDPLNLRGRAFNLAKGRPEEASPGKGPVGQSQKSPRLTCIMALGGQTQNQTAHPQLSLNKLGQ